MEKSITLNSSDSEIIICAIRSYQKSIHDDQVQIINSHMDADERRERIKELQTLSNRAQKFVEKLADAMLGGI